jgi:mono/diheme cytochrome c family protein
MRQALLVTMAGLAASCSRTTPAPASDAATMQAHYALATVARDAVVAGDLETAKAAANGLSQLASPSGDGRWRPMDPDNWQPLHKALQTEAEALAAAPDLPRAGAAVARVAGACGNCHTTLGAGPLRELVAIPPQAWSESDAMRLHQWAADWMWLGLVADSPFFYQSGARELATADVGLRWDENASPAGFRELEQLVRLVGERASAPLPADQRVELYGNFVGVCAQCHRLLRPR